MQELKKQIIAKAFIIGGLISLVCLLLGFTNVSLGVLLGTLVSILNFRLLAKNVENFNIKSTRLNASFYFFSNYLVRYGIMGIILWLSLKYKGLHSFIGTVIGLFMIRASIFYNTFRKVQCKT